MGIFNNLRKRIVHKLIREEDGYTYTADAYKTGPVKFYCDGSGKYYYSCIRCGQRVFYEPTLMGWKHAENDRAKVPVSFSEWLSGILDNIYDSYSERLSNISRKELKNFNRDETGEKIVINKQSFCDIMEALDKYWENLRNLEGILNVYFEDNMLTTIFDKVVDALEEDLEPDLDFGDNPAILDWLLVYDAGRDEKAKEGIDGHPLTTAEELYDYLVWKRDFSEKTS